MEKIKLETLWLDRYGDKYKDLKESFDNESKSRFIQNVVGRLERSKDGNDIFANAFVVLDNDEPVGYIYITSNVKDEVFLEVSVLKDKRNMGYGTRITNEVTDYLFSNYNIRCVKLDIDPSNKNSIMTAEKCFFEFDEEDYEAKNYMGHMLFYKESDCYVNRRNKR